MSSWQATFSVGEGARVSRSDEPFKAIGKTREIYKDATKTPFAVWSEN